MLKRKSALLILGVVVLVALLACNFPGIASTGDSGNGTADNQPVGPPPDTQPPPSNVTSSSGVPTITVKRGTGYVFATQQETTPGEDYNIYWNNAEICALGNHSDIVSMGVMADITAVTQISIQGMTAGALVPTQGEAFAVRIVKDDGFEYAVIRFTGYGEDNAIILEYIYPFQGQVIDNP